MPRLFVDYDPAVGPSVRLALKALRTDGVWGPEHRIDAVIDGGATRSSLRVADAASLGLDVTHRVPGPPVILANGVAQQSERLTVPLYVKIIEPATGSYWGPTFQLEPTIKASGDRLLGTADFFEAFEVAFWPGAGRSRYSLVV